LAAVSSYQVRAGGMCAVFNNRITNPPYSARMVRLGEQRLIAVGLRAVEILAAQDHS